MSNLFSMLSKIVICVFVGLISQPQLAFSKAKKAQVNESKKTETVLEPELKLELIPMNGSSGSATKNIVEIAVGSGAHKTLVTAVKAAGLVDTLTGPGPYTLFAPSDEAFSKLPKGTVEGLLKPEKKDQLKSILEHHAAAPSYGPQVLAQTKELDMVDGPKLKIENRQGHLFVEGIEVKKAILASNGIIYLVDTVLLP